MIVPDSMGKMRVAGKKGMGHSAKSGKQKAEAVDQIPMGVNLYCWGTLTAHVSSVSSAAGLKSGQSNRINNFWGTVPKSAVVGFSISQ